MLIDGQRTRSDVMKWAFTAGGLPHLSVRANQSARAVCRRRANPFIRSVYIKYLGVPPTAEQLSIWQQRLHIHANPDGSTHFEHKTYYRKASCDPRGFILTVYYDVLGIAQPSPQSGLLVGALK